ncbi:MAG: glycosyltransferase [bacterium]|nr:glycosyltransferase [bacterium]
MRIVFVTTKFDFEQGGGSTPELMLKIRSLQELGHSVKAVTLFSQNNRGGLPKEFLVHEERVGTSGQLKIQTGAYRMLKKYENDADLFYVDGVVFLYGAGLYRSFGGAVPVALHFNREQSSFPDSRHVQLFSPRALFRQFRRHCRFLIEKYVGVYFVNHCDLFTCTSPLLKKLYVNFGIDESKVALIRDFVDASKITQSTPRQKTDARQLTVMCSGRMVWEKGFDVVIQAIAALPDKNRVRVVMSGDGPDRPMLEKMAQDRGVSSQISFTGWMSKESLIEALRSTDIFIVPRWRPELASMMLFEAMGYGLPCLVPGNSTLSWSGGDGVATFTNEDPKDLARCIITLLDSPSERVSLAKKALAHLDTIDYRSVAVSLESALTGATRREHTARFSGGDMKKAFMAGSIIALCIAFISSHLGIMSTFFNYNPLLLWIFFAFWMILFPITTVVGLYVAYRWSQRGKPTIFQLGKYGIVGLLNTFFSIAFFNILILISGISVGVSVDVFYVIAFVVTVTNSFFWNKFWIFEHGKSSQGHREYIKFFTISSVIAFFNTILVHLWVNTLGTQAGIDPKIWANIIVGITIPTSFLGNYFGYKLWVFRKK